MSNSDILGAIAILLADANAESSHALSHLAPPVNEARVRLCTALGVQRRDETPEQIRAKLSATLELTGQDWPPGWPPGAADSLVRRGRELAAEENDPELLAPVDRLYYASWLIRDKHPRVTDDDWMLWGNLADHLEWAAGIPRQTGARQDWRAFNRAADLASGVIRILDDHTPTRAKLLRWVNEIGSTV
jgi:hypothetical protein